MTTKEATIQAQWSKAAADAHDALQRLVSLKEHVMSQAEDVWTIEGDAAREMEEDARQEAVEPLDNMEIEDALAMAESAEDFVIPEWVNG